MRIKTFCFILTLLPALTTAAATLPIEKLARPESALLSSDKLGSRLAFDVDPKLVDSISVMVTMSAANQPDEQYVFEVKSRDAVGRTEKGRERWNTARIAAALARSTRGKKAQFDKVELSYVVRKKGMVEGSLSAVQSPRYTLATRSDLDRVIAEQKLTLSALPRADSTAGQPDRRLDSLDQQKVQAAVDRLAAKAPKVRYSPLPGEYKTDLPDRGKRTHPRHGEAILLEAIRKHTEQKKKHPERNIFLKFTLFVHNSKAISEALMAAHRAGVRVEGHLDWHQVRLDTMGRHEYERLREAGIPLYASVRSANRRTQQYQHAKMWILGEERNGEIVRAHTFEGEFNTTFNTWSKNQEAMVEYRNNSDVATVFNYFFEAMKGNAPFRLTIDPTKAQYIATHPLYPYRTPEGRPFASRQAMELLIDSAREKLDLLQFQFTHRTIARKLLRRTAQRGLVTNLTVNGWRYLTGGGRHRSRQFAQGRFGVFRHHYRDPAIDKSKVYSPIHHKGGNADDRIAVSGSWNPVNSSDSSDEILSFHRNPDLARRLRAQNNRLVYHPDYDVFGDGAKLPPRRMRAVKIEVRLPKHVRTHQIDGVFFGYQGSPEADANGRRLELHRDGKHGDHKVFTGISELPEGFQHRGRAMIRFKGGHEWWAPSGEAFFNVSPQRRGGRLQRVRIGFKSGR